MTQKDYKPIPFWSWNGKLEEKKLLKQIHWMNENGFGGFFMHARGGLDTPYMEDTWFDCIKACCDEAQKRNMQAWAYDENGWPSGFADGKLLKNPDDRDRYLTYTVGAYDESAMVSYRITERKLLRVLAPTSLREEYLNVYEHIAVSTADILNKDVVDRFIAITHERYKKELGQDFSDKIVGFFTDEPQYHRWSHPYTRILPEYFRKKYQEDLLDGLGLMFLEKDGFRAFRYKYWICMQELMLESFGKNIYDWCENNGLKLTGHYYEEATLAGQMKGCAGIMPFYEYEHIPGVDKIGKQLASPASAKQVSSVARQLGKKQVITESYAGCGWNITPLELKRITEHQYVCGVNLLCHHLLPYSETGQRKRDFPVHFSDITPWMRQDIKTFNDYFTKLGWLLGESEEIVKVACFCPIRSVYLRYNQSDTSLIKDLEDSYANTLQMLSGWNIPYHIIDETLLEKHGCCEGSSLRVGLCKYDTIVFPKTETISRYTYMLLRDFCRQGGKVLFMDSVPQYLEGEPFELGITGNVTMEQIRKDQPYTVDRTDTQVYSALHEDAQHRRFLYAVNVSADKNYEITFDGAFKSFRGYDIETGESYRQSKTVSFRPGQSRILYFSQEDAEKEEKRTQVFLDGPMEITDVSHNYMTLDKVRVSYDGVNFSESYSCARVFNDLLEKRYEGDLWLKYEFEVKTLPKQIRFLAEDMNTVSCTFNGHPMAFDGPSDLDEGILTADIAAFCREGINEAVIQIRFFERESVYYALFGGGVTESLRNCIVYDTSIEACYLQGDFGVYSENQFTKEQGLYFCQGDFYLDKRTLTVEDTVKQGYPFFAGKMTARMHFESDGAASDLHLPKNAHLCYLKINDQTVNKGYFDDVVNISDYVKPGDNVVEITVYSGNRNLLGPHHYGPEPEPNLAMPNRFDFILYYKGGKCARENKQYSFVEFL